MERVERQSEDALTGGDAVYRLKPEADLRPFNVRPLLAWSLLNGLRLLPRGRRLVALESALAESVEKGWILHIRDLPGRRDRS